MQGMVRIITTSIIIIIFNNIIFLVNHTRDTMNAIERTPTLFQGDEIVLIAFPDKPI